MLAASAVFCAAALVPVAAQAQSSMFAPIQPYGTIGYAGADTDDANVGAIQGRLGARFGSYLGLEGELGVGVKDDTVDVGGTPVDIKLRHQEAIYGVGFVPLTPHFDILGRVGYGHSSIRAESGGISVTDGEDSWNYGAGAQYTFDDRNGVRVDYTRHNFQGSSISDADVWSVAYLRKF
jgi:hypothetical protein